MNDENIPKKCRFAYFMDTILAYHYFSSHHSVNNCNTIQKIKIPNKLEAQILKTQK